MSTSPTQHHYPGPDKCIVFWDYENVSVPRGIQLRTVVSVLKERIWDKIGPRQIPIHFKLYIRASKLQPTLQEEMDINGIEHINIASKKPESVDKRMLIDISLHLYELEKYKKSNAIALISGDKDFGHLLSRIHKEPPISHSLLILWGSNNVNPNLSNNVDFVINDINSFRICPDLQHCNGSAQCGFYHPTNYNSMGSFNFNQRATNSFNSNKKRKRKHGPKRYNKHNYNQRNDNVPLCLPPPPHKRSKPENENENEIESDSSIEIIDNFPRPNSDKITIRLKQIGTEQVEMMDIDRNETIKDIMHRIETKYKVHSEMNDVLDPEPIKLLFNGRNLVEFKYLKVHEISTFTISDGDTLMWTRTENENKEYMERKQDDMRKDESENEDEEMAPPALELQKVSVHQMVDSNHNMEKGNVKDAAIDLT